MSTSISSSSSMQQHLHQEYAAEEDAGMRSFMMHRFLQAAEEVAAEHESSSSPWKRKNHPKSTSSSTPERSQRTPSTHFTKSRSPQQAPNSFANSCLAEDNIPHSTSGLFFCAGLKRTVLFHACRRVDSVSHPTLRKKSWAAAHQPTAGHMKVANEGTSLSHPEMEGLFTGKTLKAMEGTTKYRSAINTDVPVLHPLSSDSANVKESRRRHAAKYPASFSRRDYPRSDGCTSAGCNPSFSQSNQSILAGNQFENMKSKQSPHDDHLFARKFESMAPKEQDIETVQEGVTPCNQERTCDCKSTCVSDHVKNLTPHDLAGENSMSSNTFQDYMSGFETNSGKSTHKDANHDEDDDFKLCDALSRLNSGKSDTTFYTFGSAKSEWDVLGFECERINGETDFNFETSHASMSENNSVLSHVSTEDENGTSGKMASLSQRIGKGLKLETEIKQEKSPFKHDPCADEQRNEGQQAAFQTKSFSRLWHHSFDSISGLYPSKARALFPMFPAQCQSNMPNALGWPFGISGSQSSRVGESPPYDIQQENKSIDKHAVEGIVRTPRLPPAPMDSLLRNTITKNVPSPPLPPAPTESLLGDAVAKNASKALPLAVLLKKEMVAADRRKLKSQSMNLDAERSWEDVVKGSRVHSGHLRYSEELQILMRTSL